MAGTRDAQEKKRAAVSPLIRAGIPSELLSLRGAAHGQRGEDPEKAMSEALDFVEEKKRAPTYVTAGVPAAMISA